LKLISQLASAEDEFIDLAYIHGDGVIGVV
jgi:hypothetical protein